jgi:hypothetical protein
MVWYSTKNMVAPLADTHDLVRKNVGGTAHSVIRGHLHQGEIMSVNVRGNVIGIGTGGIETETETETATANANATRILVTVVVGTMSIVVVDLVAPTTLTRTTQPLTALKFAPPTYHAPLGL